MRQIKILGFGTFVPDHTVTFEDQTRYRCANGETQVDLAVYACERALKNANLSIDDIDLILNGSAVPTQLIPSTASLIHERIAKGRDIPAFDVNSSCSGFLTALDVASLYIKEGQYEKILIVSEELASAGLNPNQKESYELFSDGAAAVIITASEEEQGILAVMQKTFSEGAHYTEIRGGGTGYPGYRHEAGDEAEYLFDMKGKQILFITARYLPKVFKEFYEKYNLTIDDIDLIVPHQASKALSMFMGRMGIPEGKYVDVVKDYGNMVSASVPFTFCKAIEEGRIQKGDTVLLCATAAGLTVNMVLWKL
ncbi:MAG: ketoacyl-ACP synthase III [Lachnospiraceae bacterium]|nr:ketoacyl-ACP synthase III [Lachnospiraceae bacterium]